MVSLTVLYLLRIMRILNYCLRRLAYALAITNDSREDIRMRVSVLIRMNISDRHRIITSARRDAGNVNARARIDVLARMLRTLSLLLR